MLITITKVIPSPCEVIINTDFISTIDFDTERFANKEDKVYELYMNNMGKDKKGVSWPVHYIDQKSYDKIKSLCQMSV